MADELEIIELRPLKNGNWKVGGVSGTFENRQAAEEAARKESGAIKAFDEDGNFLGFTPPARPIHLLRTDGSLYGALGAAAPRGSDKATVVTITPAVATSTAEEAGR